MRILISGATGVLGRALAANLVQRQPTTELVLLGRREDKLARLDDELQALGASASTLVPLDFAQATSAHIKELSQKLEGDRLDGLVLAAASHTGLHPLDHLKPNDFDAILKVGVYAPYWLLHHFLPQLKAADRARILGISDEVGAEGRPFWGAYGVAKAGLDTLLEQARQEAESQIEVRRVVPPPVASPLRGLVWPGEDPTQLTPAAEVTAEWADWLLCPPR